MLVVFRVRVLSRAGKLSGNEGKFEKLLVVAFCAETVESQKDGQHFEKEKRHRFCQQTLIQL